MKETRGQRAWNTRKQKYGASGTTTGGREKLSKIHSGKKLSDQHREKISESLKGKKKPGSGWRGFRSDEYRKLFSEIQKKNWENPEKRKRWLDSFVNSDCFGSVKDSVLEPWLQEKLVAEGIETERHVKIGRYRVDLLSEETIYEAYGCYWHCCPECFPDAVPAQEVWEHDETRRLWLEEQGYEVVIVWEHELHGHNMNERGWCCASQLHGECRRLS